MQKTKITRPSYPENEPIKEGKLNEVKKIIIKRPNGTLRIQQDFEFCPSLADQVGESTDLTYLVNKYKPDELAAYIAARNQHRLSIDNHDWSNEPSLQEAKNRVLQLQQAFATLPDDVKAYFNNNHLKFLKFIDDPQNQQTMLKLGLLKERQIAENTTTQTTTTQEAKDKTE